MNSNFRYICTHIEFLKNRFLKDYILGLLCALCTYLYVIFSALCCFALVGWTIVVTGKQPTGLEKPSNITQVMIDDTKSIENLNFTIKSVKAKNSAESAKTRALGALPIKKLVEDAENAEENKQTVLRTIKSPIDDQLLCQCVCDLNVSSADLLEAIKFIAETKRLGFRPTQPTTPTTPTPTPVYWKK